LHGTASKRSSTRGFFLSVEESMDPTERTKRLSSVTTPASTHPSIAAFRAAAKFRTS
jgi:hypothetical protein